MSTLITGASGFIGSHLARYLVGRGERVRVLVRPQSDLRALAGLAVEPVYGDLRNPASLEAAMEGVRRVYHVAADYRLWAKHPQEIYDSNVLGTRNILEAARPRAIERFIYTSSVATLASPSEGGLPNERTEARLEEMIGHYKRSKYLAEQEAVRAAGNGLPVVIVNPTAPVGPWDWKPTPTGRIVLDFLQGRMPAYLDTGLNLVPVEDVAVGHALAAERGRIGERYILGARNMTLKEILEALSSVSGRPAPKIRLPYAVALAAAYADYLLSGMLARPPRIPLEGVRMAKHKMFVDCSKAERDLGFRSGPVEAALERAVRWYTENNYVRQPLIRRRAAEPRAA